MKQDSKKARAVKIAFPEDLPSAYATNLVVQHTKQEFFISFFVVAPPLIVGTAEEKKEQAEAIKQVKAQGIVKIIVSADRMTEFIQVMSDNRAAYLKTFPEGGGTGNSEASE